MPGSLAVIVASRTACSVPEVRYRRSSVAGSSRVTPTRKGAAVSVGRAALAGLPVAASPHPPSSAPTRATRRPLRRQLSLRSHTAARKSRFMPCSGPMKGSKRAPDRDLLLARHSFPGEYVVKAFGPGRPEFAAAVEAVAVDVLGTRYVARTRMSRHGNK